MAAGPRTARTEAVSGLEAVSDAVNSAGTGSAAAAFPPHKRSVFAEFGGELLVFLAAVLEMASHGRACR